MKIFIAALLTIDLMGAIISCIQMEYILAIYWLCMAIFVILLLIFNELKKDDNILCIKIMSQC